MITSGPTEDEASSSQISSDQATTFPTAARQPCACRASSWRDCLARTTVPPCSEWASPAGLGGLSETYCKGCLVSERIPTPLGRWYCTVLS
jgi:hypothetical protein